MSRAQTTLSVKFWSEIRVSRQVRPKFCKILMTSQEGGSELSSLPTRSSTRSMRWIGRTFRARKSNQGWLSWERPELKIFSRTMWASAFLISAKPACKFGCSRATKDSQRSRLVKRAAWSRQPVKLPTRFRGDNLWSALTVLWRQDTNRTSPSTSSSLSFQKWLTRKVDRDSWTRVWWNAREPSNIRSCSPGTP